MRALIKHLSHASQDPIETILVVGAGAGNDLPAWRELHGKRLILAEAHPRLSKDLAQRIEPSSGEEAWPLAIVAAPSQQAVLQVLNNPLHNSLLSPQGLIKHYPNLRVVNQAEVAARSLGESIEGLVLDARHTHLLVLDAPGQAGALLEATPAQVLQSFTWIMVRCGMESLYADEMGLSDVKTLLREMGFDVLTDDPEAIYPQTALLFKRNDDRVRINQLEVQLQRRGEEFAVQAKLASQHEAELSEATQQIAEHEKLATDRHAQIQKLTQERDEQGALAIQYQNDLDKAIRQASEQEKLATDRHAKIQKLTQERDEQGKLAIQYKDDLDKATQQASEQEKLATERHAQAQKLAQERDEQTKLAAQNKADLDKALQQVAELQKLSADHKVLLDKLSRQNQERGTRIIHLEREHAELNKRQAWLDQEMIKAEAQVDLIKDVLLRERAL